MAKRQKNKNFALMSKNPDNWKGIFYVNRKDPRIIVPKQNPAFGWTLNFGSVYAFLGLVAIILLIAAFRFLWFSI